MYLVLGSTRRSHEEYVGAGKGNIRPDFLKLTPSTLRKLDLRQHLHHRKLKLSILCTQWMLSLFCDRYVATAVRRSQLCFISQQLPVCDFTVLQNGRHLTYGSEVVCGNRCLKNKCY